MSAAMADEARCSLRAIAARPRAVEGGSASQRAFGAAPSHRLAPTFILPQGPPGGLHCEGHWW
jgi:hypothetical protein